MEHHLLRANTDLIQTPLLQLFSQARKHEIIYREDNKIKIWNVGAIPTAYRLLVPNGVPVPARSQCPFLPRRTPRTVSHLHCYFVPNFRSIQIWLCFKNTNGWSAVYSLIFPNINLQIRIRLDTITNTQLVDNNIR